MARIFRALLIAAVNAIQEFFAFATKECLEEGLINITNNGCTDLGDGLYQGGNGKSLEMSDILPITNANSWEFQTRYTYKSSASQCTLLGYVDPASNDYKTPWIFIQSNTMSLRINSSVWQSTFILEIDKTYDIKVGFTGTAYYIDAKLDTDENYTNYLTQSSTTKQNNTAPIMLMDLGYRTHVNQYYNNGIIDMTRTKFIIDDITTYFWSEILNVGDNIKLNDGMATSNYDWSAYPVGIKNGTYTQTGTVEQIKEVSGNTVYVTQEPEQDNKDVSINSGEMYYAYTNANDESVYATDNPIIERHFQLLNATVVGELNKNNGIYSGFGTSNYLQSNFIPDLTNPFTFIMKFKQNSTRSYNWLFATTGSEHKGFACFINSSNKLFLSTGNSAGNGWQIDRAGVSELSNNRDYWLKYTFDGTSTHNVYLSTTGEFNGEETTEFTKTDGSGIYSASSLLLGHNYSWNGNHYFDGFIDMLNTSITINNVTTDFGSFSNPSTLYDNTFTALNPQPEYTVNNVGLINATEIGTLTNNNGIYSGFSSSNYIQLGISLASSDTYKFITSITTTSSLNRDDILSNYSTYYFYIREGYLGFWDGNNRNTGTTLLQTNSKYWVGFEWTGSNTITYFAINDDTYTKDTLPPFSDTSFWTLNSTFSANLLNGQTIYLGGCNAGYITGSLDMNNTIFVINGNNINFYNKIVNITIDNIEYTKTSDNDLIQPITATIETVDNTTINSVSIISDQTATIETSANITTSNNNIIITDGSYHLFNLTVPTSMTAVIESNGISYQTNEMPLLLKNGVGVGLLLKNGNNVYYRNTWIINRDYDLHFQEIRFATNVQDPTITLKINNVLTSAPYYTYAGDKIEYIISKEGYCDYSGSFITSYTSKDGKIITIDVELTASNGTVDVSNYEYTLNNQGNMILTKYKGGTDTVVPNV